MTLNLVRRSTKGTPLTAADHDGNLDKLEQAIEAFDPAEFATAAQGAKADSAVQPAALSSALAGKVDSTDPRLTDAREWSADTVSQAEAEGGTATTRRAFTAQRVRQAIAAWWNTITSISLPAGSAPGTPATGLTLFANASNAFSWIGANGFTRTFDGTANTASRAYTLQNKSGTLAHLDDIPTVPGVATTSAAGLMPASSFAAITYAADIELDMAALDGQVRTISLTGNLSLTSVNRAAGRSVSLRIIADGTQRTLTFPSGWVFIGSKPANIAASKTGVLSLTFFGTASTDAVAAWGVQA